MANNERNMLKVGVGSLIRRQPDEVHLVRKAGRPGKGADQNNRWSKSRNITTSMVMDKDQHNQIKRLANRTGNTFKETMYLLLQEGLNRYDCGDLVITNPLDES